MKTHILKTESEYFWPVCGGMKSFEIRKNDRDFQVGDKVTLVETKDGKPTGRITDRDIRYVFDGGKFGLDEDYCIFCW